jgi:IMP dehydrogenase
MRPKVAFNGHWRFLVLTGGGHFWQHSQMEHQNIQEGITFDDVLLIPQYSDLAPSDTVTSTRLTQTITLNIPLVSAPMDTVTESELAISLAQEGGIGIIHKNLTIDEQALEVAKVKRNENGIIADPIALSPEDTVARALTLMDQQNVSGFPVTMDGTSRGQVAGILTRRDMKFVDSTSDRVGEVMTHANLITATPDIELSKAEVLMTRARVEKLILLDSKGCLAGLVTMRDIENIRTHPNACRDNRGRLRVGAAVGVHQLDRVAALVEAEVDVVIVDTAHGHSANVIDSVKAIKSAYDIQVIAGNVATREGAQALIDAGVDAVKVGIGPGSICTTRIVSGVGVPQLSAIQNACEAAVPAGIPVIADGGIRQSGDIPKAIGFGAESIMLGSLFAGLDESPGELILHRGRHFKSYRGMGSLGAMGSGSADRYGQGKVDDNRKYVPEGVEGRVPYRGSLADFVYQMVGGLRAAMGYCGCTTIQELRDRATFVRLSSSGLVESHAHDIQVTKEAPNYQTSIDRGE